MNRFQFPKDCTIYSAAEIKAALQALLSPLDNEPSAPLELDYMNVEELDASFAQILYGFCRNAAKTKIALTHKNLSDDVRESLSGQLPGAELLL